LMVDEPFFLMSDPSFWCSFWCRRSASFRSAVLLATAFFMFSALQGWRQPNVDSNNQIHNDNSMSKMVLLTVDSILPFRLLQPLVTQSASTAAVPSCLVGDLAVPLVEAVQWRIDLAKSTLNTHSFDLRNPSVNLLIERWSSSVCWAT